jgi:hypothetical protein
MKQYKSIPDILAKDRATQLFHHIYNYQAYEVTQVEVTTEGKPIITDLVVHSKDLNPEENNGRGKLICFAEVEVKEGWKKKTFPSEFNTVHIPARKGAYAKTYPPKYGVPLFFFVFNRGLDVCAMIKHDTVLKSPIVFCSNEWKDKNSPEDSEFYDVPKIPQKVEPINPGDKPKWVVPVRFIDLEGAHANGKPYFKDGLPQLVKPKGNQQQLDLTAFKPGVPFRT